MVGRDLQPFILDPAQNFTLLQVLDKNTCKLVAGEYDMLVVDKEEVSVTDGERLMC